MDIGDIVDFEGPRLLDAFGLRLELLESLDDGRAGDLRGRTDMRAQIAGQDDGTGTRRLQHAGNARHIGFLAPDIHRIGHRAWNQAGILATEKHYHEVRAGLGNDRHALAALQAAR